MALLRFPNSAGDSKPAMTKSATSGTESKGAADRRNFEAFVVVPGIGATISEFFDNICLSQFGSLGSLPQHRFRHQAFGMSRREVSSQTADFEWLQLYDERSPVRQRQQGKMPRSAKPWLQA